MTEVSQHIQDTFLESYDANADGIFRYFLYRLSDRETAKDLVQETFAKTWVYLQKGGTIQNMRAFLYTVASRLTIDHYRSRKEEDSLENLSETTGFEPSFDHTGRLIDELDGKKAMTLISQIPEPYGSAVLMRYVEEFSLAEISDITGENENTVSVHVHRGLAKLKSLFEEEEKKRHI